MWSEFHSRCLKTRPPPPHAPHPYPFHTHFLNWKWNAAVFPSALRITPLICHERYPRKIASTSVPPARSDLFQPVVRLHDPDTARREWQGLQSESTLCALHMIYPECFLYNTHEVCASLGRNLWERQRLKKRQFAEWRLEFRKIKHIAECKQVGGGGCFCVPCPFSTRALRELLDSLM